MFCDLNQYRAQIGLYYSSHKNVISKKFKKIHSKFHSSSTSFLYIFVYINILLCLVYAGKIVLEIIKTYVILEISNVCYLNIFIAYLLMICGDIEINPGPRKDQNLSICHWNLNSIAAHNFAKLSSLQAFNSIHKFDLICISETFLDSSFAIDETALDFNGYKLVRSDHPDDVKRGGVCIYYKDTLPIRFLHITNLSECLICEILYDQRKCFIVSLYRSPSQTPAEFDDFIAKLEIIIDNIITPSSPNLIFIVGDFNAKLSNWNHDDPDTDEGIEISTITSSYGLTQIINEPTHILPNSSSCIDLLFTNQPNMVIKSGIYSSLHPNCHHQIIYANINFKLYFPPPYERQVWHYSRGDIEGIKQSIENLDWNRLFRNLNVNQQVETFNNYLMNIFQNYIPNEIITINDRDPPWITDKIRKKILCKNQLYKKYQQNGKTLLDLEQVQNACLSLNNLISDSKKSYYKRLSNKLSNPKTNPKTYWTILKSLFCDKKVPVIPHLVHNNENITDFKCKANLFNSHFSKQCSLLDNYSTLPLTSFFPLSHPALSSFAIDGDSILNLIRSLDIHKSHGYDNISIRMLKLCDYSVVKPLMLIFNNSLNQGVFPKPWKKANVTPIHKKGDKTDVINYRPISVLPICGKIFERIIFNSLYNHFEKNDILNANQSGFRIGDSCINQLISITHNIYQSFDASPTLEVRGVFLDISKAFDKVWHEGLIFKLKANGVEGKMLNLIESFLNERYQRVVLNGQHSEWEEIKAGVPQGSILGPLLFLIYINDLSENLESDVKLFADDTSIFSIVHDNDLSTRVLDNDLMKIQEWAYQWKMSFNPDATKQAQEVIFSRKNIKPYHPTLHFNQSEVNRTGSQKHLGVILDEKLNFNQHLKVAIEKTTKGISMLHKLRYHIPRKSLITLYKSFIRSHLDFADVIYDQPNNKTFSDKIESIQYNAALAITGAIRGTSKDKLYKELGLEYLSSRRWLKRLTLFHKIFQNKSPTYLYNIIPKPQVFISLRNQNNIPQMFCRTDFYQNSFFPSCIKEWNKLSPEIRAIKSLNSFRNILLKTIKPIPNSVFDACDPHGLKLLTRLRVGLSHLREHKFKHGFNDTIDPFCPCNMEIESVSHFFLRCDFFTDLRTDLMNDLFDVDQNIQYYNENLLTEILLFGKDVFSHQTNSQILDLSISYILKSERFDGPLL